MKEAVNSVSPQRRKRVARGEAENSVSPPNLRSKQSPTPRAVNQRASTRKSDPAASSAAAVPEDVRKRFVQVAVALLSTCLVCTACTTTRQVPLAPAPSLTQPSLKVGNKAFIVLRSGAKASGTIVAVDANGLTLRDKSDSVRGITFEDMESLRTARISRGRTAAAIVGGVLTVALGGFLRECNKNHCFDSE